MEEETTDSGVISAEVEYILHSEFMRCRKRRDKHITVEHLLLALAESKYLEDFWKGFGVNQQKLAEELINFIDQAVEKFESSLEEVDTEPNFGFQRVIQRAILHVQASGKQPVRPINLLVAIYGEKDSHAVEVLSKYGINKLDVINYYTDGIFPISFSRPEGYADDANEQFLIAEEVIKKDEIGLQRVTNKVSPPRLFISYSHADQQCLDRLLVHLRPLHKSKAIVCWSDKNIRIGDKWRTEIKQNLDDAAIAILLVSADFLASDFIVDDELPPLLVKAESKGMRILPVILKPCGFLRDSVLSSFQAVNDPSLPLLGLNHIDQEAVYNQIADEVSEEIRLKLST